MAAALLPALPAVADDLTDRIQIHGFLSQAWAKTDGEQFLGIPEDGTYDYRNLALQIRGRISDRQALVLQLGHESRGESPRDLFRDDVELDWAFYEARSKNGHLRLGRMPVSLGIYSELRDVGHLLPFYGPPITIYGETSFASDAIEGIGGGYQLFTDSPWNLELDAFYGEASFSEKSNSGAVGLAKTRDDWGFRAWLNTPVEGLRVGYNHHTFEVPRSVVLANGKKQEFDYLSIDWTRDRWMVRAEGGTGTFNLPFGLEADVDLGYLTLGFSPVQRFWVYLQSERRNVSLTPKVQPDRTSFDSLDICLTYALRDTIVVKLEHHDVDTTDMDRRILPGEKPAVKATILSLSVAF